MMRTCLSVALASALSLATPQRFRTNVDAVRVDVLVVDGNRPVVGLVADDFELRDSGVVQAVDSIAVADVPISMMIALDTSQSVAGGTLERLREGVTSTLGMLTTQDRAAVLTFSSELRLAHDWSSDVPSLTQSLTNVRAAGGTALWDATFAALAFTDSVPTVRRLVLVFSDGVDTASWLPRQAVIDKAKRTDAVLYSVSLRGMQPQRRGATLMGRSGIELSKNEAPPWLQEGFLAEVADATGGTDYTLDTDRELRNTFARIVTEFRTRYVLSYSPQSVDRAGWHPIEVKLKSKRGTIKARRGYSR